MCSPLRKDLPADLLHTECLPTRLCAHGLRQLCCSSSGQIEAAQERIFENVPKVFIAYVGFKNGLFGTFPRIRGNLHVNQFHMQATVLIFFPLICLFGLVIYGLFCLLKVDNRGVRQPINLNLWDTAGQVREDILTWL